MSSGDHSTIPELAKLGPAYESAYESPIVSVFVPIAGANPVCQPTLRFDCVPLRASRFLRLHRRHMA